MFTRAVTGGPMDWRAGAPGAVGRQGDGVEGSVPSAGRSTSLRMISGPVPCSNRPGVVTEPWRGSSIRTWRCPAHVWCPDREVRP
jgi:hypothetical protein